MGAGAKQMFRLRMPPSLPLGACEPVVAALGGGEKGSGRVW